MNRLRIAFWGTAFASTVAIITVASLSIYGTSVPKYFLIGYGLHTLIFCVILMMSSMEVRSDHRSSLTAANVDNQPSKTADTWRIHKNVNYVQETFRVALISCDNVESSNIATNLTEVGCEIHHCNSSDAMLETVLAGPDFWDLVIFDLDTISVLEVSFDEFTEFRMNLPGLPLLVLSNLDDNINPSRDRLKIGDATLRKPVSQDQLMVGIEVAILNSVTAH